MVVFIFFVCVANQEVAGTLNNDNSLSSNPNDIEIKYNQSYCWK